MPACLQRQRSSIAPHPFTKPGRSTIYQLLRLNRHGGWDIETSSPTISRSSLSSFLAGFALEKAVLPGFVPVAALSCALSSSGTFGLTGLTLQALLPHLLPLVAPLLLLLTPPPPALCSSPWSQRSKL